MTPVNGEKHRRRFKVLNVTGSGAVVFFQEKKKSICPNAIFSSLFPTKTNITSIFLLLQKISIPQATAIK